MKDTKRFMLVGVVLSVSVMSLAFASSSDDTQDVQLTAAVTAGTSGSGIIGTATVYIGEDGLRGRLDAHNLKVDHAYTVWMFDFAGTAQGGPGRFDSKVAEDGDFVFRGRVGGLRVSAGDRISLVIFDHPDLGPNNATHANKLLNPAGGWFAAKADFTAP